MNHHCVPEFEVEDDCGIATASASGSHGSGATRVKKAAMGDEGEIIELLWQNGQVVLQSQNQISPSPSFKKSTNGTSGCPGGGRGVGEEAQIPIEQSQSAPVLNPREIRSFDHDINTSNQHHPQELFMQEDEMATWLHYPIPIDGSSFVDHPDLFPDDFLYPPPPSLTAPSSPPRQIRSVVTEIRPPALSQPGVTSTVTVAPLPPIPPPLVREAAAATTLRFQNFSHFSKLPKAARIASGPSSSARELAMVDPSETPVAATISRVPQPGEGDSKTRLLTGGNVWCGTATASIPALGTSTAAGEMDERTVTSSPDASGGSARAEPPPPTTIHNASTSAAVDRKRKGRETDDTECRSEDVGFESVDAQKQARGFTSTKRSRAAEVHNLSERRRRDRINERMKALQELIPRCNKSDKASMLDEAIEYLKSLQLQVQMMSMGCGMFPLMYPGVQQYMPGIGMGMGLHMGMEMATNRPIMPYPHLIPTSGMPNLAVAANMGPRFPVPAFHMHPPVPLPDSSRPQASNQVDPMQNSLVTHNPNRPRMPNFPDPYQQFIGLHHAEAPLSQHQAVVKPDKPSSSRGVGNPDENHQSG